MLLRKGSNQYKIRPQYKLALKSETWASIWFVAFATAVLIPAVQPHITSPCPADGCYVKTVMAYEEKSELQQITDYIVKKFETYGRNVAVKALECFISESRLNSNAYAWNDWNQTADVGIGQINDVHGLSVEERKDWKRNIDKSLDLFLSHNKSFSPWYGKGCK